MNGGILTEEYKTRMTGYAKACVDVTSKGVSLATLEHSVRVLWRACPKDQTIFLFVLVQHVNYTDSTAFSYIKMLRENNIFLKFVV